MRGNRLTGGDVAALRRLVEGSTLPLAEIAARAGVAQSTVSRYAKRHGWRRGPQATPHQLRREAMGALWELAAREARELVDRGGGRGRGLSALAALVRAAAAADPAPRAGWGGAEPAPDAPPSRSPEELREELARRLDAMMRRQGYEVAPDGTVLRGPHDPAP